MISAVSKYGAASSAKRIISTALIAKLEATMQLLPVNAARKRVEIVVGEAGRADDAVHAVHRPATAPSARAASSDGEVDRDLDAARRRGPAARR